MIRSFTYPNVFHLSGGHYMVNHVTDEMMSVMWVRMSQPQKDEFAVMYGADGAEQGFRTEVRSADHAAAFFCCSDLTCIMWATWSSVRGIEGRVRILGCVCSDYAIRKTINFVRHSVEVRSAFELMEPGDVKELYVFITKVFKQSRNWAVRVCNFKEVGMAKANGEEFAVYRHVIGEE